eukprot:scaffold1640_cov101-Cylindrotheca_fusiformis.AAC.4
MNTAKAQRYLRRMKRNFSSTFTLQQNIRKPDATWFQWYSRQLDERPVITKCLTASVISSTGSVLAQYLKHHNENEEAKAAAARTGAIIPLKPFAVEWDQVGRFAFLNAVLVAPVLHHWYAFINRRVPGKSMSRVLQRTFWDEFVFSPIYIPVFLGGLWTLEGTSPDKIKTMLKKELPSIITAEWILWVPTMALTFRFAPVKFQVLVINCVGVVWQTFLSFMANKAHGTEEIETESTPQEVDKVERVESITYEIDGMVGPTTIMAADRAEICLDDIFEKIETW